MVEVVLGKIVCDDCAVGRVERVDVAGARVIGRRPGLEHHAVVVDEHGLAGFGELYGSGSHLPEGETGGHDERCFAGSGGGAHAVFIHLHAEARAGGGGDGTVLHGQRDAEEAAFEELRAVEGGGVAQAVGRVEL